MLAMLGLAVMGAVYANAVAQHQHGAVNHIFATQALYLAEAGFELAVQELIDGKDYAFNGVGPNGGIGGLSDVLLGAGKVSVVNNGATPAVLTATGEVAGVKRTLRMTVEATNLITQDWTFPNTNLNNWAEFDTVQNNTGSAGLASPLVNGPRFASPDDGTTSFKIRVEGKNSTYIAYREQAASIPANKPVTVRLDFKKDYVFASGQPQGQELALFLWRSGDGSSQNVWSDATKSNANTWQSVFKGGVLTGSPVFDRVRLYHRLEHNASASNGPPADVTEAWVDNISISIVNKSAWKEP